MCIALRCNLKWGEKKLLEDDQKWRSTTIAYACDFVIQVAEEDLRSLMFGDYMNPDLEPEERVYEEIQQLDSFYSVAESCLDEYNNTHKTRMNLVIFR